MTPAELDASQGWPTLPQALPEYVECMSYDMTKLDYSGRRKLVGNGIHLYSLSVWMVYFVAHCIKRSAHERLDGVGNRKVAFTDESAVELVEPSPDTFTQPTPLTQCDSRSSSDN